MRDRPCAAGWTAAPALRERSERMCRPRSIVGCVALLVAGTWSLIWGAYALTMAPVASGVSAMSQEALALTAEVIAEAEQAPAQADHGPARGPLAPSEAPSGGAGLDRRLAGCGAALLGSGALALVAALLRLRRRARRLVWAAAAAGVAAELVWLAVIGTWIVPALGRAGLYLVGGALAAPGGAGRPTTDPGKAAD